MVYRMAWTLTANEADAHDLAHDTMVAALGSLGRFRRQASLSTWLTSILLNRHRSRLRSHAIRRRLQPRVEAARPTGAEPTPESPLEQAEEQAALKEALERLDEDERTLVALSFYEELDSKQIGELLGRPAGTVRSQLHDVREKLKRILLEIHRHES